jgi:hypothetical protein
LALGNIPKRVNIPEENEEIFERRMMDPSSAFRKSENLRGREGTFLARTSKGGPFEKYLSDNTTPLP